MVVAKAAGEEVTTSDTTKSACQAAHQPPALRYEAATKTLYARRSLVAGASLGRVYFPTRPAIVPGAKIIMIARIGHVSINRPATALQAAQSGQRFFARLADGEIVIAPPASTGRKE
jgi:flagella basal body P-ring formation protein FlgA